MEAEFIAPTVPIDSEGYCQSFYSNDANGIRNFFHQYGFVVVRDALPQENISATLADIFAIAGVDPARPDTWLTLDWNRVFGSKYNAKRGFLGYEMAQSQAAWNNRQLPSVYQAFCAIFQQKNLWVKLDRYGFMRPTRGLVSTPKNTVDKVEWETERNWVHWDQNPWMEPEFCRVQSLFTLTDHTTTSGGFHCIPGFTHYFKTWAEKNIENREDGCLIDFFDNQVKKKYTTKITMRSGSLLMWDSRTPHGNFPNESQHFRIVQYTGMFPVPNDEIIKEQRLDMVSYLLRKRNVELTDLGKKIAGTEDYTEDEEGKGVVVDSLYNADQCGY